MTPAAEPPAARPPADGGSPVRGGPPTEATFDAVVLAGGTARRLGGASKPDVQLAGRRLLDHALDAAAGARRVVVVAPDSVAVPAEVRRTLEDPPSGGPVAGIAAGLDALEHAEPVAVMSAGLAAPEHAGQVAGIGAGLEQPDSTAANDGGTPTPRPLPPLVLVLACDVPGAASAVPRLLRALADGPSGAPGACLVDAEGRPQWLLAVYRRDALRARLADLKGGRGVRDAGVRSLVGNLPLVPVEQVGDEAADIDTWSDLAAFEPPDEPPAPR